MSNSSREITRLLQEWSEGSDDAFYRLSEEVYPELKQLAERHVRRERPGGTLEPTALVNEAYLRMVGGSGGSWESRLQFFKLASRVMRHVLLDYFRAGKASKRGGGERAVTLADEVGPPTNRDLDLEKLQDALAALHDLHPLRARIVELRFFGGMTVDEVTRELGLNRAKVKREWAAARSWLYGQVASS